MHEHRCIVGNFRFGSSVPQRRSVATSRTHIQDCQGGILKGFSPSEETREERKKIHDNMYNLEKFDFLKLSV